MFQQRSGLCDLDFVKAKAMRQIKDSQISCQIISIYGSKCLTSDHCRWVR